MKPVSVAVCTVSIIIIRHFPLQNRERKSRFIYKMDLEFWFSFEGKKTSNNKISKTDYQFGVNMGEENTCLIAR